FAYDEKLETVPSHRALALFRGRKEDLLRVSLKLPEQLQAEETAARAQPFNACERLIASRFEIGDSKRPADTWLLPTVRWAWSTKLAWQLETALLQSLRERAAEAAIQVFARNLRDLLLAPPAGRRATMGLEAGLRTGVKVAIVDQTGKLLETATVYPHAPRNDWDRTIAHLALLAKKHDVDLVSIGNGTASRETDKLVSDLIKRHPELELTKVVVSEA